MNETWDEVDERIAETLLLENSDVFRYYLVDLNETPSDKHKEAEKIFKKYNYPSTLDEFLKAYRKWCKDKQNQPASREISGKESFILAEEEYPQNVMECFPQTVTESRFSFEPAFRYRVDPPFRKRKRQRYEFNAVDFLVGKKRNDEVVSLTFQTDEDIQDKLVVSEVTEKKKLGLLADGLLRKIADQIELLNQMYNYRILDIHYEY